MEGKRFSIGEAVSFGWATTTKNIVFVAILLVIFIVIFMISQFITRMAIGNILFTIFATGVSWVVNIVITLGLIKIALKFYDDQKPGFEDLYSSYPLALNYIGAFVLFWLVCGIGLLLLIVPGIILMLRLQFFAYFIVDKKSGPIEALKASWETTRGSTLSLLALWFTFLGIALVGVLVLLVGLFIAIPIIMFAMVFVYRKLAAEMKPIQDAGVFSQQAKPKASEKPSLGTSAKKEPGTMMIKLNSKTVMIGAGVVVLLIVGIIGLRSCERSRMDAKARHDKTVQKNAEANKAIEEAQATIARIQAEEAAAAKARPPILSMEDTQRFDALQKEWAGNLDGAGKAISTYDFSTCDIYIDKCLSLVDSMKQIVAGKTVDERLVTARLGAIETMTIAYANTNEILAITKNPTSKDRDWPELTKLSLETMEYFNKAAELFDYSDAKDMGDICREMRASVETLVVEIKQKSSGRFS